MTPPHDLDLTGDPELAAESLRIRRGIVEALHDLQRTEHGSATEWFDAPLVGVAGGADPLFADYKRHVGPAHWTPLEAFTHGFPGVAAAPDELAVISWVLPHADATRRANRAQAVLPAERWAQGKATGEALNNALRARVVELLASTGVDAVAPVLLPAWRQPGPVTSVWSERHAAYAAGLGTFGLCDGLITPLGKAMRCGSVVARMALPPTPRPYRDHHAYCLAFSDGSCRACAARCPVGAITDEGHDKLACSAYLAKVEREFLRPRFGISTTSCGLCQTGVPCESRIPARRGAAG
jgi:epoxyqueuosine reductase